VHADCSALREAAGTEIDLGAGLSKLNSVRSDSRGQRYFQAS